MIEIDFYSLATVPVQQLANGQPMKGATAFVWQRGPQHYLITNWHVATGRNARTGELETEVQPDMLRALFNTRMTDFGKKQIDIKIRDEDHRPLWFAHPLRQRGSDVVAIPLPIPGDDPIINMYPINSGEKPEVDLAVKIGMDVFVLGYPFGADPPGFPVWKRGSIASQPHLTRPGLGYMLVDTASRPGMSGAPVIRRSWSQHLMEDGTNRPLASNSLTRFIGVYSGRLYTKDPSDAQIGMVWPVEDIEEIIDGAKLDQ
jgi:hypothetical protein